MPIAWMLIPFITYQLLIDVNYIIDFPKRLYPNTFHCDVCSNIKMFIILVVGQRQCDVALFCGAFLFFLSHIKWSSRSNMSKQISTEGFTIAVHEWHVSDFSCPLHYEDVLIYLPTENRIWEMGWNFAWQFDLFLIAQSQVEELFSPKNTFPLTPILFKLLTFLCFVREFMKCKRELTTHCIFVCVFLSFLTISLPMFLYTLYIS